jgi:hypothetical protein
MGRKPAIEGMIKIAVSDPRGSRGVLSSLLKRETFPTEQIPRPSNSNRSEAPYISVR